MKRLLLASAFFLAFSVQAAEHKAALTYSLDGVPVSQVLRVIYSQSLKNNYVLDPAALADSRPVSFRWDGRDGAELKPFLTRFLDSLGYQLDSRGGVDFVRPKADADKAQIEQDAFIYRPRFRDGSYIADILQPLFKGSFTIRRAVAAPVGAKSAPEQAPAGSAAAMIERSSNDTLVFVGAPGEVAKLQKLLPQVDTAVGEVMVRAVIYQVQTTEKEGSAVGLAASLLGGKLEIGYGGKVGGDNFVRLKAFNVDAILTALSGDTRFKVVSAPTVRVKDGAKASFVVGQDVPVLGALSYPQGSGQAVQSVEYRKAGVILNLSPRVRAASVDLDVDQQLSNFVQTETGVNNSPTLISRSLQTSIAATDGDVIVLGGLTEDKENGSETGLSFLPKWAAARSSDKSRSEILLVLQVNRMKSD